MTRPLALFLLLAAAAVAPTLAGCSDAISTQPRARGEAEIVDVVTDSATWAGPVGEALRAELGRTIPTLPSNQGAFRLRFRELTSRTFGNLKLTPQVVFAAPIDAPGEIGDFLRARVGEGNLEAVRSGGSAAINLREDLWAQDQLITIATAASDTALAQQILRRGPELRAAYERLARERTQSEMFSRLRQTDLEEALLSEEGFRVAIQHDYVQVQDTAATAAGVEGEFRRYRRVLSDSWRDFFVFYADGYEAVPSEERLDAITNGLLRQFAEGVYDSSYVQLDDQRPQTNARTEIGGRPAAEQRGFWYMTNDVMGGSYVRYAFVDEATDRLYLYYGMTFAPDRSLDKRKFLRQMEAVGYTLRTAADVAAEQAAPPES